MGRAPDARFAGGEAAVSAPMRRVHRDWHGAHHYGAGLMAEDLDVRAIRNLAVSIVSQAVDDYIMLIRLEHKVSNGADATQVREHRAHSCGNSNYIEIEAFFRSEYGEMLCEMIEIDSGMILNRLRSWRAECQEKGVLPKRLFQKAYPETIRRKDGKRNV